MGNSYVLKNVALFHITHINYLPGILKKGVLSKNNIISQKIRHIAISRDNMQQARAHISIPGTNYSLHDCVPAFFGACPPMLLALRGKGIQQEKMLKN